MSIDDDLIRRAPKVLLHDHLDGGLRPQTVFELAAEIGHELPASDPAGLGQWFLDAASSGSLVSYLETFAHTVAVMQTETQLRRVAREYVEDMVADGVVYAETRWAPSQHVAGGLSLRQAVEAVQAGLDEGVEQARAMNKSIMVGQLLTALRHQDDSVEIADLAVELRGRPGEGGVVGFDIAGPEAGFPPSALLPAIERLKVQNMKITIHAGEAFGLPSIWQAVQQCGADRIGHGTRLIDDVAAVGDGEPEVGVLAGYLRDDRTALELCPTSNVQTGAAASIAEHPIETLYRAGFRTTVNTDNRLMSGTSMTTEFVRLSEAFGWDLNDVRAHTLNAAKSCFLPFPDRRRLIEDVIIPGFAALV